MVASDAIITTSMVSRVLGQYDFRWPDTQGPFTDAPLKAGIIKIIEARSFPIVQLTEDAGDGISRSLSKLSTLHKQLAAEKPLSLQEAMESSATLQVLLNQLKARNYPTDLLMEVLKAINTGV